MQKKSTRSIAFLCNIFIAILSILAISSYLFLPFWKVKASYHVDEPTLESAFEELLTETETENSDVDFNAIVKDAVDEEGITLNLSLTLESKRILSFLKADAKQSVSSILEDNVTNIINELSVPLEKISKNLVKATSKQAINVVVRDQVQSAFTEEKTDEEIDAFLTNANITDSYIEEQTDKFVDVLYNEATIESVTNQAIAIVEDVVNKLSQSGEEAFKDMQLTEEDKTQIKQTIEDVLASFTNENGEIVIDDLLSKGLSALLNENGNQTPDETPSPDAEGTAIRLSAASSDSSSTEQDEQQTQEELEKAIREKLMEKIPEETIVLIAKVMKIIAYVLLFSIFTWAYLILKILLKLRNANNTIKLKLPIWLGWLPFTVLYAIPTVIFKLLKNPPASFGAEVIKSLESLKGLSVSFYTGAWVAFAAAIVLLVFSFFYGGLRKKLKAIAKGEIEKAKEEKAELATAESKKEKEKTEK